MKCLKDVGITEYLGDPIQFGRFVIKHKPSDFIVKEIPLEGKLNTESIFDIESAMKSFEFLKRFIIDIDNEINDFMTRFTDYIMDMNEKYSGEFHNFDRTSELDPNKTHGQESLTRETELATQLIEGPDKETGAHVDSDYISQNNQVPPIKSAGIRAPNLIIKKEECMSEQHEISNTSITSPFISHRDVQDTPHSFLDIPLVKKLGTICGIQKDERTQIYQEIRKIPFLFAKTVDGKIEITLNSTLKSIFKITLMKINLTTSDACSIIANRLGINKSLVSSFGNKDKRAVTFQQVTISGTTFFEIFKLSTSLCDIKSNFRICGIEQCSKTASMGKLQGNSFVIKIRTIKNISCAQNNVPPTNSDSFPLSASDISFKPRFVHHNHGVADELFGNKETCHPLDIDQSKEKRQEINSIIQLPGAADSNFTSVQNSDILVATKPNNGFEECNETSDRIIKKPKRSIGSVDEHCPSLLDTGNTKTDIGPFKSSHYEKRVLNNTIQVEHTQKLHAESSKPDVNLRSGPNSGPNTCYSEKIVMNDPPRAINMPSDPVHDHFSSINVKRLENGFINYFGPQRFGGNFQTHQIGKLLLERKYLEIVDLVMAIHGNDHPRLVQAKKFFHQKDYENSIKFLGHNNNLEKRILYHCKTNKNIRGVFYGMKKEDLKLYYHAHQSFIFNKEISSMINKAKTGNNIESLRYKSIALEKFDSKHTKGSERKVLEFCKNLQFDIRKEFLEISFELNPSTYATMALREIIGNDILNKT